MKHVFFLFFLLIIFRNSTAQVSVNIHWYTGKPSGASDTIHYDPERKLQWKDFAGPPDMNSGAAAITESGFGYRLAMRSVNGRMNLDVTIFCYFNRKMSWVKRGMNTAYALTHEQHHFDITWINTCAFVRKLKAARFTHSNYASLIDSIYDGCYESLRTMQDAYDGQTSNGRNRAVQAEWNSRIEDMLAAQTKD